MHLRRVLQPLPAEGINPRRENGDGSAVAALHAAPPVPPMAFWGCQSLVAAPQLLSCTIYSLGCGGGGTARSPQSITRSLRSTAAAQPRGPFCLISQMILFSFFFLFFFFPPAFPGQPPAPRGMCRARRQPRSLFPLPPMVSAAQLQGQRCSARSWVLPLWNIPDLSPKALGIISYPGSFCCNGTQHGAPQGPALCLGALLPLYCLNVN